MINFDEKAYEHFKTLIRRLKIGFSVEDMLEVVDSAMVVLTSIFRQGRNDQINSLFSYGRIGSYYDRRPKNYHYTPLTYGDLLQIIITSRVPWKFIPLLFEESNEGYITRKIINLLLDFHEDGIYAEDIFRQAFKRISFIHPPPNSRVKPLRIEDVQMYSNIMYLCFGELFLKMYCTCPPGLMTISLHGLSRFVGGGILEEFRCYFQVRIRILDIQRMAIERFMDEYNQESTMKSMYQYISTRDRTEIFTMISMASPEMKTFPPKPFPNIFNRSLKIDRHHQMISEDEKEAVERNSSDTWVEKPSAKRSNQNVLIHEYLSVCKTKYQPLYLVIKRIIDGKEKNANSQKH